jgi:hypothetical protein
MSSEANQQVQEKPVAKHQTQELTDLTSFNAFAYATLSDGQTVGVQLTGRHGIPADRMYVDFKEFIKFLDMCAVDSSIKFLEKRAGTYSSEANGKPTSDGAANGGKPTNGSGGSKRNYKDPVPQAELPAELAEVTVDIWAAEFDALEILPKPDEKASINFIKDGLQYPVGSINKWKYATIKEFLASLTEDEINPAVAKVHRIAGVLYWKQGNAYTDKNGVEKHYKDVVLAKPAF